MIELSIIVPHYNSGDLLERLIRSIPEYNSIEIVVVDDHSNAEEVRKLDNLRHKYVNHNIVSLTNEQGKKSAGAARNKGLVHASGEWILFADSDDYFLKDFYETVYPYFESNEDIVYFTPTSVYNRTDETAERHVRYERLVHNYLKTRNWLDELKLRYNYYVPWSKLYRKSFLQNNSIDFEEVLYSNDVLFSLKAGYYARQFDASPKVIYCVTKDKGSLTTTVNEGTFDTRFHVFLRENLFLRSNLPKADFNQLELNGRDYLLQARRFGWKKTWVVYMKLKKYKVRVFSWKVVNPLWVIRQYKSVRSQERELKKYTNI